MDESTTTLLPPVTNRGVEAVVGPSWVAGSVRVDDDGRLYAMRLAMLLGGPSHTAGHVPYYDRSIVSDRGGWGVAYRGLGGAAGTVGVVLRQTYLESGYGLARSLELLGGGLAASRLDLAMDDLRANAPRPRDFFNRRGECWTRTHRGRWVYREDGRGRQTLNIGAGASDRQARIYDHAPAVLRHEVELRGKIAAAAGKALGAGAAAADLWTAEYARLVRWAQ